jgi:hypothetical protein
MLPDGAGARGAARPGGDPSARWRPVGTLARRLRTIRLTRPDTLEYHPSFVLRGLTRLDVAFTAAL